MNLVDKVKLIPLKGCQDKDITRQIITPSIVSLSSKKTSLREQGDLLKIKGFVTNIDQPEKTTYDLILSTPGFMLGKLLKQDSTLGNINGSFVAKGNGIDFKYFFSKFFSWTCWARFYIFFF